MAITKIPTLKRVLVVLTDTVAELQLTYHDCFDDPNDDELPHVIKRTVDLQRYDAEGNATDVTSYEQIVQDLAAVVWADEPASDDDDDDKGGD